LVTLAFSTAAGFLTSFFVLGFFAATFGFVGDFISNIWLGYFPSYICFCFFNKYLSSCEQT